MWDRVRQAIVLRLLKMCVQSKALEAQTAELDTGYAVKPKGLRSPW